MTRLLETVHHMRKNKKPVCFTKIQTSARLQTPDSTDDESFYRSCATNHSMKVNVGPNRLYGVGWGDGIVGHPREIAGHPRQN